MSSILNANDEPLSEDELIAVRQNAKERFAIWRKRSLSSTAAFLLSCMLVYLFLEGSPLHAYWDSAGQYLLLLSMALLLVFVYCTALLWGSWRALRGLDADKQ
jgi:hypothetical protein